MKRTAKNRIFGVKHFQGDSVDYLFDGVLSEIKSSGWLVLHSDRWSEYNVARGDMDSYLETTQIFIGKKRVLMPQADDLVKSYQKKRSVSWVIVK